MRCILRPIVEDLSSLLGPERKRERRKRKKKENGIKDLRNVEPLSQYPSESRRRGQAERGRRGEEGEEREVEDAEGGRPFAAVLSLATRESAVGRVTATFFLSFFLC